MNALLIHRWDGDQTSDWYDWLKGQLAKKDIDLSIPNMPDPENPVIVDWVAACQQAITACSGDVVLIGHSVGCQTILRTLEKHTQTVKGCVLVAPWFALSNLDEEEQEVAEPWLTKPIDFQAARSHAGKIIALFSRDDAYVPLKDNQAICEKELQAECIIITDRGHFTDEEGVTELPELVNAFESIITN